MKWLFMLILLVIFTTTDAYGFLNKDKGKPKGKRKQTPDLKMTVPVDEHGVTKRPSIPNSTQKYIVTNKPLPASAETLPQSVRKATVDKLQLIEEKHYHGNRELLIKHLQRQIEMKKKQEIQQKQGHSKVSPPTEIKRAPLKQNHQEEIQQRNNLAHKQTETLLDIHHAIKERTSGNKQDRLKRQMQPGQQHMQLQQTRQELAHQVQPQQQTLQQQQQPRIMQQQNQIRHHIQPNLSQQTIQISQHNNQQQHNQQQQAQQQQSMQLLPQQPNMILQQQQRSQPQQQQQLYNQQNMQMSQQSNMISLQHGNQQQVLVPQQQKTIKQVPLQSQGNMMQEISHIEQSFLPQQDLLQIQNQFENRNKVRPQMQMQPMDMHQPMNYLPTANQAYKTIQTHAQIQVQQPQIRIQPVQHQQQQQQTNLLANQVQVAQHSPRNVLQGQHVLMPINSLPMIPERYVLMGNAGTKTNNHGPAPVTPTPPSPTTSTTVKPPTTTTTPKPSTTTPTTTTRAAEHTAKGDNKSFKQLFFEKESRKQDLEILKLELEIRALKRAERNGGQLPKDFELEIKRRMAATKPIPPPSTTTTTMIPFMDLMRNKKFPFDF